VIIDEEDYLAHYGTLHKSGRYPWGSGDNPAQSIKGFLDYVDDLKKQGLSEVDIARGQGMTVTELRNYRSIANNLAKQDKIDTVRKLKNTGMSNLAIGKEMGINESSVRSLINQGQRATNDQLRTISNMLKDTVDEHGYLDVGSGVEIHLNISRTKLNTALAVLKAEGYTVTPVQVPQLGTGGNQKTIVLTLAPRGTTYKDIVTNMDKIHTINKYYDDKTNTFLGIMPPLNINSSRLAIKYDKDGGSEADGVIYVRPGVKDISLGQNKYAQVRIAVDGTHYIKGMAIYKNDLPNGVDLVFNTNKSNTGNKLDALKKLSDDPENPFGAVVRQITDMDAKGNKRVTSAMNLVNEEGRWDEWNKSLSSQMLSKQTPRLAKTQLDATYKQKREALDEILSLTNPAVRQKLLDSYADGVDSSAFNLKAAHLPRQATHVIMPVNSLKDNEIYAQKFNNGERVVLIRFPHGGIFEIPELTVNNNNRQAKDLLGDAIDAVGINHKVAARLSGADFDGDTVLVIPNNNNLIKTKPALASLKDFDPKAEYKLPKGVTFQGNKQQLMGDISNLITDMTIKGANDTEIAQAVRHSMVVIDSEKHDLDHKKSARDHQIALLKTRYQGGPRGGASTIVSRKKTEKPVLERKLRSAKDGGPIDKKTGKLVYQETGKSWVDKKTGKTVYKMDKVKWIELVEDANDLSSGTSIEKLYADHSNRLRDLGNKARKELVNTKPTPVSHTAKKVYADEVTSLDSKLKMALRNRPLERGAQLMANAKVDAKKKANPNMEPSELKKIKYLALEEARARLQAKKNVIEITPREWEAIQAGAISHSKLKAILDNADMEKVKQLATPRTATVVSRNDAVRIRSMQAAGHTLAEIAGALGVSVSTIQTSLGSSNG
jgi:DNA-binding CsgD family transcriptional regulator